MLVDERGDVPDALNVYDCRSYVRRRRATTHIEFYDYPVPAYSWITVMLIFATRTHRKW